MSMPHTAEEALAAPETGLQQVPLPWSMRLLGGLFDALRWKPWTLEPERLMRAAGRAAGLPPLFPPHVHEALNRLCTALNEEAELHWFGRANQQDFIVTGLAALLRVEDAFRKDPALAQTPLVPPLVVLGLPRSGTTFLHRLLCDTPDARALPFYEHVHPVPGRGPDLRRLELEVKFVPWRMVADQYHLDAIHFVRPGEADECNFSLRLGMRSMVFWSTAPIYSYLEWVLQQDMREAYQTYRRVLQHIQHRSPGKRLTLKCPSHCAYLPALVEAIPEALLVQTHRTPEVISASEGSLILALQATATRSLDWRRSVQANLDKVTVYANRTAEFADTEAGKRVHHVDYRRLLSEPVEVAREIREGFGLPFTEDHARRLRRYAEANRQHKHGRHRYSLQRFELDEADIRARFAPYRRRFAPWLG